MLVQLCGVLGLVHDIGWRTGLRTVLIRRTGHFLPRPRYASICLLAGVVDFDGAYWVSWSLGVRVFRSIQCHSSVDDVLLLPKSHRIDRILACFQSCIGLSRFGNPWSFIPCHILLGETLLFRFGLPIIVPYASTAFDHPCTELTEHGFGSDDGNLARSI